MSIFPTSILLATDGSKEAELAGTTAVGLTIVGSRGKGRIKRLAIGSVSDRVVRHAHCPVFVARE